MFYHQIDSREVTGHEGKDSGNKMHQMSPFKVKAGTLWYISAGDSWQPKTVINEQFMTDGTLALSV